MRRCRGVLVVGEIHSARFPQKSEQSVQIAAHHAMKSFGPRPNHPRHIRMLADSTQLSRDVLGRQDEVDAARVHRVARHAVVFRGLLILGKGDAPGRLDGAASLGAVRRRPRQDDADGLLPRAFRQRPEKIVDRHVLSARQHSRTQLQHSILDGQVRIGGNHVGVVGLDHDSLRDFGDGDLSGPRQDFLQRAAMFGIEVLHQHEGHAGLFRQVAQ